MSGLAAAVAPSTSLEPEPEPGLPAARRLAVVGRAIVPGLPPDPAVLGFPPDPAVPGRALAAAPVPVPVLGRPPDPAVPGLAPPSIFKHHAERATVRKLIGAYSFRT